jgi:hypothetical protein
MLSPFPVSFGHKGTLFELLWYAFIPVWNNSNNTSCQ